MNLGETLNLLLEHHTVDPKEVFINGVSLFNTDTTDSEFINLLDVPVYHYFNNGDGTILIDTMWD